MDEQEQNYFVLALSDAIEDHPIALEAYSLVAESQAMLDAIRSNQKPQIKLQTNTRNSLGQRFENPLSALTESSRDKHRSDGSLIIQQSIFDQSIKKEIAKQEKIKQADL
ncbi:MAG: hypothetical protein QF482_04615, partial [Candidatus Poseidoniia archaeon]|nr:hypothetical protein [Candidatus Poseidoniia archaeon]